MQTGQNPVLCDTLRGVYHVCTSCPVKNALVCVTFAHMCKRNTAFLFVGQTTILPECTTCKFCKYLSFHARVSFKYCKLLSFIAIKNPGRYDQGQKLYIDALSIIPRAKIGKFQILQVSFVLRKNIFQILQVTFVCCKCQT